MIENLEAKEKVQCRFERAGPKVRRAVMWKQQCKRIASPDSEYCWQHKRTPYPSPTLLNPTNKTKPTGTIQFDKSDEERFRWRN